MTIEIALLGASVKLLSKPFDDLYSSAKGSVRSVISKWVAAGQRDRITQLIAEVELVRTISSRQLIQLSDFYYPARLQIKNTKVSVTCREQITEQKNILILGTAGQGKSIFMRYLCIAELKLGKKIPVFVELRDIDSETRLKTLLIHKLGLLGLTDLDEDVFRYLLLQGAFVFFLDGFDEVKREFAQLVQNDLSLLVKQFPATKWVVSSRAGGLGEHISVMSGFISVAIDKLSKDDFRDFFIALKVPVETMDRLLDAIEKSPSQIQKILTTPLMLTLLNLTFGTSTHIPYTLHEFYEQMFHVLVFTHDETKAWFVRQKATNLSNSELQEVFESFCFFSKEIGGALSDEEFSACAKKASSLTTFSFTAESLKIDLTETLCLMVKDGLKTTFIHKSVQEFFAAHFVKKLGNEERSKKVYQSFRQKSHSWAQELRFLAEIDKFRFLEYFRLPEIDDFLNKSQFNPDSRVKITKIAYKKFVQDLDVYVFCKRNKNQLEPVIVVLGVSNSSMVIRDWVLKLRCAKFYINEQNTARFENYPSIDPNSSIPVRFDKFLRSKKEDYESYHLKLIETAERLDKERIKGQLDLKNRKDTFAQILGI